MVLSKLEKEGLVVILLLQNWTYRQISKEAHVSFTEIKEIKKKYLEKESYIEKRKKITNNTMALQLFSKDKSPLNVCIKLDMDPQQIRNLYCHYLRLENLTELEEIIAESSDDVTNFVNFYKSCKSQGIDKNKMRYIIDNQSRLQELDSNIETLESKKREKEIEIQNINGRINFLDKHRVIVKSMLENEYRNLVQIKELVSENRLKFSRIKQMMHNIKNDDNYKYLEIKFREILDETKSIDAINIPLILIAFFEAVRKNPVLHQILYTYYQTFKDDNIKEDLESKQNHIFCNYRSLIHDFADKLHDVYSNKTISHVYQSHNTKIFV